MAYSYFDYDKHKEAFYSHGDGLNTQAKQSFIAPNH